jgi:glycine cleavage system H lipoate-binding protein
MYVDIFATKGIEYLLIIGFLFVLVLFMRALLRTPRARVPAPAAPVAGRGSWFALAGERFYHPGHTWVAPYGDEIVRAGLDDFAQKLVGVADRIELPAVGDLVDQGERALVLRIGDRSVPVLAPVSGSVLRTNEEVLDAPSLVNEDPYGRGWLLEIRVPRLRTNLKNLLSGQLAQDWMRGAAAALRARVDQDGLGPVLADGGLPVNGVARQLDTKDWDRLAREFLLSD